MPLRACSLQPNPSGFIGDWQYSPDFQKLRSNRCFQLIHFLVGTSDLYLPYSYLQYRYEMNQCKRTLFRAAIDHRAGRNGPERNHRESMQQAGFDKSYSSCCIRSLEGLHQVDCPQFWGYCQTTGGKHGLERLCLMLSQRNPLFTPLHWSVLRGCIKNWLCLGNL